MVSTGFGFGERESIANAYAMMYAPKSRMNESISNGRNRSIRRVDESCDCDDGCCCGKGKKTLKKFPTKHKVPSKTGSKLGKRKVLPFAKRDAKPSAKKFAPKVKKIVESNRFFCIADGNKVLCTNDIGESYFNNGGISGETRIYESKMSAIKDIQKIKSRRNPNSKYKVRACECVGESVQFADRPYARFVNEGLWDTISNIGSGALNAAKSVGNVAGGVVKGAGNLLQGNVAQAGSDVWGGVKDAGGNLKDAAGNVGGALQGVASTARNAVGAAGDVVDAAGNMLQGNLEGVKNDLGSMKTNAIQAANDNANPEEVEQTVKNGASGAADIAGDAASAAGKGLKTAGNALWNGAKSGAGMLGSGLKAIGNMAQGNFKEAWNNVSGGDSKNAQKQNTANPNNANPNANQGANPNNANPNNANPNANQGANPNAGGDKAAQKKQIQDQIASLQKQLQALG